MGAFLTSDGLVALATLTALEIVLGVDNLVFIAIVSARLPPQRNFQVYGSPRGETTSNSRWAQTGQYTVMSLAPSELSGSLTICAIQPGARWVTQPHSSQQSKAGS